MHRYMVSIGGPGVVLYTRDGVLCTIVELTDEEKAKVAPDDLIAALLNRAGIKVEDVSAP